MTVMTAVAAVLLAAAHVPLAVQMVTERRLSQVRRLRMVRVIWERR